MFQMFFSCAKKSSTSLLIKQFFNIDFGCPCYWSTGSLYIGPVFRWPIPKYFFVVKFFVFGGVGHLFKKIRAEDFQNPKFERGRV